MMIEEEVGAVPLTAHHLSVVALVLEEACPLAGPLLPVMKALRNVAMLTVHLIPKAFLLVISMLIHVVHEIRTDELLSESKS